MSKKILVALGAIILVLGVSSFLSPHWTVHRMRSAIETRDYQAFSSHVDFPALRESFKQQLAGSASGRSSPKSGNPFDALGRGLAGALTAPMVDVLVRPAGLIEMLNAGKPDITRAVLSSAFTQVPGAGEAAPEMHLRYRNWNVAVYRKTGATEQDGSFLLVRKGWWSWKLAGVEMAG